MDGKKLRAVLFDLDGTLLDTLDDLTDAVTHALGVLGRVNAPRRAEVRTFVGNGVSKLITRALWYSDGTAGEGAHPDLDACYAQFKAYYDEHGADKTAMYPGVKELIAEVRALGLKTGVVTNKYDGAAQKLKAKFFPEIDIVVGTDEHTAPKPARDGVDKVLSALGADCDHAVYVGDGETDIATARNAGIPVVAVSWGFRDRAVIERAAPDGIIDEPGELVPMLKKLGLL